MYNKNGSLLVFITKLIYFFTGGQIYRKVRIDNRGNKLINNINYLLFMINPRMKLF